MGISIQELKGDSCLATRTAITASHQRAGRVIHYATMGVVGLLGHRLQERIVLDLLSPYNKLSSNHYPVEQICTSSFNIRTPEETDFPMLCGSFEPWIL